MKKHAQFNKNVQNSFEEKKSLVHKALCDSINTPGVMKEISNLITISNIYMTGNYNLPSYNHVLVRDIGIYITNLMKVFNIQKYYGMINVLKKTFKTRFLA